MSDTTTSPPGVDLHHDGTRREVEARLRDISEVIAARVVPGYDCPVDEVHVVVTPGQSPKAVVGDVTTLLMAEFDLEIDHRAVSIVQIAEEFTADDPARVLLRRVSVTHEGSAAEVTIRLEDPLGTVGEGVSIAPAGPGATAIAAADAMIKALAPWLDDQHASLGSAKIYTIDEERVALVVCTLATPRGTTTQSGSAVVRRDEADATARAVLAALNRALRA